MRPEIKARNRRPRRSSRLLKNPARERRYSLLPWFSVMNGSESQPYLVHSGTWIAHPNDASPPRLRGTHQRPHSYEVVGGLREEEHSANSLQSPVFRLSSQAYRFSPTKDLFDSLALDLADRVSRATRRAAVNCTASVVIILGDVRRHAQLPKLFDVRERVVTSVSAEGRTLRLLHSLHHPHARLSLGKPGGKTCLRNHDQTISVFSDHMTHEAKLGFFTGALLV